MNKQRKIKHVLVAIVSLFIIEVIVVTYLYKDMNQKDLSNHISTSYKKENNKNYLNHKTKIPNEFTTYFYKYKKERKKNKHYKSAISLALSSNGLWTAGYAFSSSQIKANRKALGLCREGLSKYNVNVECVIYAEGLNVTYRKVSPGYNNNTSTKYKVADIKRGSFLNIRSGAGTQYRVLGKFKYNERRIKVFYCVRGWCKIENRNTKRIGWVSKKYIQKEY